LNLDFKIPDFKFGIDVPEDHHTKLVKLYEAYRVECPQGMKESLKMTKRWLLTKCFKLKYDYHHGPMVKLDESYLINILNGTRQHPLLVTASCVSNYQVVPKHELVLYMVSQVFEVNVFIFSTRAAPIWIKPIGCSGSKSIAFLHHVDSILGTSCWYYIEDSNRLPPAREWFPIKPEDNKFVATKKNHYKQQNITHVRIGVTNETIQNVIEEKIFNFLKEKCLKRKSENQKSKHPKTNLELSRAYINNFRKMKNTPTAAMAAAKKRIEPLLGRVPVSKTWFADKWKKIRKNKSLTLEGYINNFRTWLASHCDDKKDDGDDKPDDDEPDENHEDDQNDEHNKRFLTVTKSLVSVLKKGFGYIIFRIVYNNCRKTSASVFVVSIMP
jgi:hypothetical protein